MTHTPEFIERQRKAFEAWGKKHMGWNGRDYELSPDGNYAWSEIAATFDGWLACASTPVEISEAMVEAGAKAVANDGWAGIKSARQISNVCLTAALEAHSPHQPGDG